MRDCAVICSDGLVGALQNARDLLPEPLERSAHRRLRGAGGVELGHELTGLLHVGIDREPVVAAHGDREVGVHDDRHRVIGQGCERRSDL